jgi:hypothetical protein
MIKQLWGTLVCKVLGKHRRLRRLKVSKIDQLSASGIEMALDAQIAESNGNGIYYCPRCWTRFTRKKPGTRGAV